MPHPKAWFLSRALRDRASATHPLWQKVQTFADQCAKLYPYVDKNDKGMLRRDVPKTPCDLFLEFFPLTW
jgi:hypothetical protein